MYFFVLNVFHFDDIPDGQQREYDFNLGSLCLAAWSISTLKFSLARQLGFKSSLVAPTFWNHCKNNMFCFLGALRFNVKEVFKEEKERHPHDNSREGWQRKTGREKAGRW